METPQPLSCCVPGQFHGFKRVGGCVRLRRDPRIVQALAAAEAASRQAVDLAVDRYRISAERVADD